MLNFIIGITVVWRIFLFFVAYLNEIFISFKPSFPYADIFLISSNLPYWIWTYANFDGVHYLTIAKSGYWAQFTQVFFPIYPLLIRLIHSLFWFINPILIGIMISGIFFLFALIIFWKLLSLDYEEKSIRWIIFFTVIFPTSFFFGSLYTESLFIFLIFASFYAARKNKWLMAGILGGLASATKLMGIFLLLALLLEWNQRNPKSQLSNLKNTFFVGKQKNIKKNLYQYMKLILVNIIDIIHSPILYLIPLGLLSYMVYLQVRFGDWLYFWHAQPVFGAERSGRSIVLLPQVLYRYVRMLILLPFSSYNYFVVLWELISLIVGCVLWVMGCIKKIRASYLLFAFFAIIVPALTGTLSSMPRYILVAFPIYISLGLISNKSVKIFLSVICLILLVLFTTLFVSGRWVA